MGLKPTRAVRQWRWLATSLPLAIGLCCCAGTGGAGDAAARDEGDPKIASFRLLDSTDEVVQLLEPLLTEDVLGRPRQVQLWSTPGIYLDKGLLDVKLRPFPQSSVFGPPPQRRVPQAELDAKVQEEVRALEKLRQAEPDNPVFAFYLSERLGTLRQDKPAVAACIETVRLDRGRSDLSQLALVRLSYLLWRKDGGRAVSADERRACCQALSAAALALYADPDQMRTVWRVCGLARQLELKSLLGRLEYLYPINSGEPAAETGLTDAEIKVLLVAALGKPADRLPELAGPALYVRALRSLVLVRAGSDAFGSGVVVGCPTLVLTNAHVVASAKELTVQSFACRGGRTYAYDAVPAQRVQVWPDFDLCLLRTKQRIPATVAATVAAADASVGDPVYAFGNPGGTNREVLAATLSEGMVSAPLRTIEKGRYQQHSAGINPGNSGGPLLNSRGEVIGINTLKASVENMGFAIPVSIVREVLVGQTSLEKKK